MGGLIQNDIVSAHWASQSDTKTADPYIMGDIPSKHKRVGWFYVDWIWGLLAFVAYFREMCVSKRKKNERQNYKY